MHAPIQLGDLEVLLVSGGRLWIDGGNMFGVIPRVMWEHTSPPDEQHRVLLETNCLLVRSGGSLGLVDTGYGGKSTPRFRQRYALEEGTPLVRNLAALGVLPEQIDWVILTHLHFDHAGGYTYRDDTGTLRPTFPRARHYVQRIEWNDAVADLPELAGAYFGDDLAPLEDAELVELVSGSAELAPGVVVRLTGGHTRGHQIILLGDGKRTAICPVDLCPLIAHLPVFWTMAYDQFPLEVRRVKRQLWDEIVAQDRIVLFAHEPQTPAARLHRDEKGELTAAPI